MEYNAVVIDNGSEMSKVGFSGEDWPREVFPSIAESPYTTRMMKGKKY